MPKTGTTALPCSEEGSAILHKTSVTAVSFRAGEVKTFGGDLPLGEPVQPEEVAPCSVFLAGEESKS